MSALHRVAAGCRRFFSPACAVPRLRACYYSALAALAVTLFAAHHLAAHEHREARLLSVASHACQIQAALPVVFVRVPPVRWAAMKVKHNTRRTPAAAHKE